MNNHPINVLVNEIQNNFKNKYKVERQLEIYRSSSFMEEAINECLRKFSLDEANEAILKMKGQLTDLHKKYVLPNNVVMNEVYSISHGREPNEGLLHTANYCIRLRNYYIPEQCNERDKYNYVKDYVRMFTLGRMKFGILKSFNKDVYERGNNVHNSSNGFITTYMDSTLDGLLEQIIKDLQT